MLCEDILQVGMSKQAGKVLITKRTAAGYRSSEEIQIDGDTIIDVPSVRIASTYQTKKNRKGKREAR